MSRILLFSTIQWMREAARLLLCLVVLCCFGISETASAASFGGGRGGGFSRGSSKKGALRWDLSAGVTSLNYSQTGSAAYSMISPSFKFSYQRPMFTQRTEFGLNVTSNLSPIRTNNAALSVRYVGGEAGLNIPIWFIREPWRVGVMGSVAYSTLIVTPAGTMGYKNLAYPQGYPTIRYRTKMGSQFQIYFKFVPMEKSGSFASTKRDIGGGFVWTKKFKTRGMTLSVDASDLTLSLGTGRELRSQVIRIGLGIAW